MGDTLVGREAEAAELSQLVRPAPSTSRVLMLVGEAGIGKTALVTAVIDEARGNHVNVVATIGRESETTLAFASLHQLLRPLLSRSEHLPGSQSDVLRALMGVHVGGAPPVDRFLAGVSVLSLISSLSNESPVLVVVEDVHWVDPSSLDVLFFLVHRLTSEPVVVLLTARPGELPSNYYREIPVLRVEPLGPLDARRLLDEQPDAPRGALRDQVLEHAAGNPMALIELSRAVAADPSAGRRWAGTPLPVGDRLSSVIGARLAVLPPATKAALLYVAVADDPTAADAAWLSGADSQAELLTAAEELGLVRIDPTGLHFTHPLVRSTVYHGASFAQRAAVHRRLAERSRDRPDRRAWHLSAATVGPDDELAQLLEDTATEAQRREGTAAAVTAMERAAELTLDPDMRARRYTNAALLAVLVGRLDLVTELANRALAITSDRDLRLTAREAVGFALSLSSRLSEAVEVLLSVAFEAVDRNRVYSAWDCLRNAAQAAYFAGTTATQIAVVGTLAVIDRLDTSTLDCRQRADIESFRLWARCTTEPFHDRGSLLQLLDERARAAEAVALESDSGTARLGVDVASAEQVVAGSAWVLDESDRAVRLLRRIVERLRRPGVRGTSPSVLGLLGLCMFDTGRWDEALDAAAETEDLSIAYRIDIAAAASHITSAQIHALRGDSELARRYLERAAALFDLDQASMVEGRIRRARALADSTDGAYGRALAQLDGLFDVDGKPLHRCESYPGVAELADAYLHSGRRSEGANRVNHILECFDGTPSRRLRQIFLRARAVLADENNAEHFFRAALADGSGTQWPFELARLHLDYGEWLRRRRRINEAKVHLANALDTMVGLRANPFIVRARTELRACGVAVIASPTGLSELTPQQREIVRLAATGLTNRAIADRLFLSARTVSSHLYRSYPKLGVTARRELSDVIDQAERAAREPA